MSLDSNIWGLLAMPLGVTVCFGPVLVLWIMQETRGKPKKQKPTQTSEGPKR